MDDVMVQSINAIARRIPGWVIYPIGLAYAAWIFYLGATGAWVEPIEEIEHRYGKIALQLILASLVITPLRQSFGLNFMCWRRALGVTGFFFVLAHLSVWAILDVQQLSAMWADIVERPYVTIGMVGFVLLVPLAITSNDLSVRKLGAAAWRKLHKIVYPAAVLGALHWVWLAKGFQIEPLVYLAITLWLVALRYRRSRPRVARPTT